MEDRRDDLFEFPLFSKRLPGLSGRTDLPPQVQPEPAVELVFNLTYQVVAEPLLQRMLRYIFHRGFIDPTYQGTSTQ